MMVIKNKIYLLAAILTTGIIILVRYNEPLFNPHFYTEDGTWLWYLMEFNFWNALHAVRPDYYVLGNLILLKSAQLIDRLFFNEDLLYFPLLLYIITTFFYISVYCLHFWVFKNILKGWQNLLISIFLVSISLNGSDYEIFGRASNVGFMFYYIALMSVAAQTQSSENSKTKNILQDGLILLSIHTNPLTFLLLPFHFLNFILGKSKNTFNYVRCTTLYILSSLQLIRILSYVGPSKREIGQNNIIEVVFGRGIFFPFTTEKYYHLLNDISVILLFILSCSFLFKIIRTIENRNLIKLIVILIYGLMGYNIASAISRPFQPIIGYISTFPDRYFIVPNTIIVLIFLLILFNLNQENNFFQKLGMYASTILLVFVSFSSLLSHSNQFQFEANVPLSYFLIDEEDDKCKSHILPINPGEWRMEIPHRYFKKVRSKKKFIKEIRQIFYNHVELLDKTNFKITGGDPFIVYDVQQDLTDPVDFDLLTFEVNTDKGDGHAVHVEIMWESESNPMGSTGSFKAISKTGKFIIPLDGVVSFVENGITTKLRIDLDKSMDFNTVTIKNIQIHKRIWIDLDKKDEVYLNFLRQKEK